MVQHKQRLFRCVNKTASGNCWVFNGQRRKGGYGTLQAAGKSWPTHRLSWVIHFGAIPKGLFVLHHCDNPPCINPEHLFLGTHLDNMRDRKAKGRYRPKRSLTTEQILNIKAWKEFGLSCRALAKTYKVSAVTISSASRK